MSQVTVKHVLYSHYGTYERSDFDNYNNGTAIEDLEGIKHLEKHFRGLKELLTTPGHEGLLVLFYAPGFAEFLSGIAQGKTIEYLVEEHPNLKFADAFSKCVRSKLIEAELSNRVRFVTSIDLGVIFGQVHAIFAENFRKYFIGAAEGLRFDSPKIPEAILRLRLIGNGVPVLRLDHDVLFRFGKIHKVISDLGLFKAVTCSTRAYHLRMADPTVSTFLFSASYNSRELKEMLEGNDPSYDKDKRVFDAWSKAFATRIYPALIADINSIKKIQSLKNKDQNRLWEQYVIKNMDESLAKKFFGLGLRGDNLTLEADGTNGLTSIGAHPYHSVISGALLCLSEGAILDLPPFSNFRNNVMWIDDHLKYSLHRAMHHFTSEETLNLEPGLSDARLDDVTVTKERQPVRGLPAYVLGTYLPTLLWGSIVDSWITDHPIVKCRFSTLTKKEQQEWLSMKSKEHNSPLPRAMLKALREGHFGEDAKLELRKNLWERAIIRIEEVRQLWTALKNDKNKSFAAYWAEGTVKSKFPKKCFEGCENQLWEGITQNRPIKQKILRPEHLSTAMYKEVAELVEDTVTYVLWTLDWPKFVQIVRSVRQGTFIGDLSCHINTECGMSIKNGTKIRDGDENTGRP